MKTVKKSKARKRRPKREPFPTGAERKRLQALADYYDNQSDEEAIAEAEAAYNSTDSVMMQIPLALVPKVQRLLSRAG